MKKYFEIFHFELLDNEFLNNHKEKLSHALLDLTQALYLTMTSMYYKTQFSSH
jgi:hypothetical protein